MARSHQGARPAASGGYDVFISYSHSDAAVVEALHRTLQQIGKPWYRRRALSVFRDETGLSANPGLWSSITDALDRSRWFVMIASPDAAASEWVGREIAYWIEHRDAQHILPVVVAGEWRWNSSGGGFDAERSNAVPDALLDVFAEEPRHLDLTWAAAEPDLTSHNSRFRAQVTELAAPIHGVSKEDLVGDDLREHRRTIRITRAAVALLATLVVLASAAALVAVRNAHRARVNEQRAEAATAKEREARAESDFQRLIAQSRAAGRSRQDLALLLAVEARHLRDEPVSRGAIQAAILDEPRTLGPIIDKSVPAFTDVCPLPGNRTGLVGRGDGTVGLIDLETGAHRGDPIALAGAKPAAEPYVEIGCSVRRDGSAGVVNDAHGSVWQLDVADQRVSTPISIGRRLNDAAISPDGHWVAIGTTDGLVVVWPYERPDHARQFHPGGVGDSQAVAFSPDGRTLATTSENEIVLRDTTTWEVVGRIADAPGDQAGGLVDLPEGIRTLQYNADGTRLLNSRRGIVRLIDARSGAVLWKESNDYLDGPLASFVPGGEMFFAANPDLGFLQKRAASNGAPIGAPINNGGLGVSMAFGADGGTLYTTDSVDGRGEISRWALDGRSEIGRRVGRLGEQLNGLSPDGRQAVLVPAGNSVVTSGRVVELGTGRERYHFDLVGFPTLVGHDQLAGYFAADGLDAIIDLKTGQRVGRTFSVPLAGVTNAQVSVETRTVFVGYDDGSIRRFTFEGRQIGDPWLRHSGFNGGGFGASPRGDLLAVPEGEDSEVFYRLADASVAYRFTGVVSASFSRDGKIVALAKADLHVELRDARTGRLLHTFVDANPNVDIPRGGPYFATRGGTTQLYDVATRQRVGDAFPSLGNSELLRNGSSLVAGTDEGVVQWDLDPDHWEAAACRIAARNLTLQEWKTYFPGRPPRATCRAYAPPR